MATVTKSGSTEYCPQIVNVDNNANFMNIYDDYACASEDPNSKCVQRPAQQNEQHSVANLTMVKAETSTSQIFSPNLQNSTPYVFPHSYQGSKNRLVSSGPFPQAPSNQVNFVYPESTYSFPSYPDYPVSMNYTMPYPSLVPQPQYLVTMQPYKDDSNFNYQMDLQKSMVVSEIRQKRKYTKRKGIKGAKEPKKQPRPYKKRKETKKVESTKGSETITSVGSQQNPAAGDASLSHPTDQMSAIKLKKAKMAFPKYTFLLRLPDFERDDIDASHHIWCVDNHQLLLKYVLDKTDNLGRYYVKSERYSGWLAEEPWHYAKLADVVDYDIIKSSGDKTTEEVRLRFPSEEVVDELVNKMHMRIVEEEAKKQEELKCQKGQADEPTALMKQEMFHAIKQESLDSVDIQSSMNVDIPSCDAPLFQV